ncbi:MAG: pectate lyase [Prevotella sp.]|nr:pectate lyase [Prevotella sp.]
MKKYFIVIAATAICTATLAQAPAFPGAEGHGRYTAGGRGGKIVHVTNLNDSGTGSFRQAVSGSDRKTVVFDVGGVIALKSDLNIGPNTTVMGQTAPAPGITLRYYTVNPNGNNIVIRYIRMRRGSEKNVNDGADASTARNHTGIIIDHCSLSWSIDEVASFYDNNNFTMQWCTIGESLNNAGHNKGAHGYGGIWGGKLASFHHNLICHVNNRSPRFNGARYEWTGYTGNKLYSQYKWENTVQAENVDFRNCVIYNCGNGCYGGPGGGKVNIVNNYYKTGPTATTSNITNVTVGAEGNAEGNPTLWDMTSRYFIEGNQVNNATGNDWTRISYDNGTITLDGDHYSLDPNHYNGENEEYVTRNGKDYIRIRLDEPAPIGDITTHTAAKAYEKVLTYAGASLTPDDVDLRYFNEAKKGIATYTGSVTGKKGRIDLVSDVNGYTEANFGTGSRPEGFDSDKDGIPDEWERANGLNPNNANDANQYTLDATKKWYTNLEVYANSLVQDIMLNENADADEAVTEYYPAYVNPTTRDTIEAINPGEPDDPIEQSNVTYTISQSTNTGNNTSALWEFDNDITVSNAKSKTYQAGKNDGIKYSSGVQYTINLPQNVGINKMTITGYDNYADVDSYLSELNGTIFDSSTYVFPQKDASGNFTMKSYDINLPSSAVGCITFTPQGKQVVWSITLMGIKATTSIPNFEDSPSISTEYYNLQGMCVNENYRGITICKKRLANGKYISKKKIRQ